MRSGVRNRVSRISRLLAGLLTALLLIYQTAWALPTGWQVEEGNVTFLQKGNVLTVASTTSKAVVSYVTFNLASGETIRFILPNANASILNQVVGGQASRLAGAITSNGQVAIVNPAGITVATSAQIKSLGLILSSLKIGNDDFMAGRLTFGNTGTSGAVINNGTIKVGNGGYAALIGQAVENNGRVIAANGHIALAAGDKITLNLSNNQSIEVTVDEGLHQLINRLNAAVNNKGILQANTITMEAGLADGLVATAVNNAGITQATAMGNSGGDITLFGHGGEDSIAKVTNTGSIIAVGGKTQNGGAVKILGDAISQSDGALVNASGGAGGGTVLIGGDLRGEGDTYRTRGLNETDNSVKILADSTWRGNGGKVIVWSDDDTEFAGNIFARGGRWGGNGGFAEVSGKQTSGYVGMTNTLAPRGRHGLLLLDPTNIVINNGAGIDNVLTGAYYENNLQSQATNISLVATNNVTMNDLSDNILGMTTNNVGISLTATSGTITFADTADTIRTEGGAINLTSGGAMTIGRLSTTGSGGAKAANITLSSGGNISVANAAGAIKTNTGTLSVSTAGTGSFGTAATPVQTDVAALTLATGGNVYVNNARAETVTGSVGGNFQLQNTANSNITLNNLDVTGTSNVTYTGTFTGTIAGTGNTFRGVTTLDTNNDTGANNINISGDFRAGTVLYGSVVTLTDTAGDLLVTDVHTGTTGSVLTASNGSADVATSWVVNGEGSLAVTARDDLILRRTAGYTTTLDHWILNSTNGGDVTVDDFQLLASGLTLQARTTTATDQGGGIWIGTNGGRVILNNVVAQGPVDIQAKNSISGTGNSFTGNTIFDANLGTAYDVSLTNSNFGGAANVFDGANVTATNNSGNFAVTGATSTGTLNLSNTAANGNLTLSNVDAGGAATLSVGTGTGAITGSSNLIFRNNATFTAPTTTGTNNIALTADFRGNTSFTGNRVTATNTAGNFTVTGLVTGSNGTNTLTSNTGNLSISGVNLNTSAAAGRLDASASGSVSLDGTGWTTTGDIVNLWSTGGGNMTLSNVTLGGTAPVTGTVAATNPNQAATGIYMNTNGGGYTLTNDSIAGNTSITSKGTITGSGDTFSGTTSFLANAGATPQDINITASNFAGAANVFNGANVTAVNNSGNFAVTGATSTGTLNLSNTAANGNLTLANVDAGGTATVSVGTGTGAISGSSNLVFRNTANFTAPTTTGTNNIALTADFRGNTNFTGNQVTATDTAGDFTVTTMATGNSASASTLTTNAGNLSLSGINLNSTGATSAGRLDASASGNVAIDGTGWTTTNDVLNAWSTGGGNMTVSNTTGLAALDGAVAAVNPNSAAAGMHLATNGGNYTLTNDGVTGNTAIISKGSITGTNDTFTGTTNFAANAGATPQDISFTGGDFQNATNAFNGKNVTVTDNNALTISSVTATGNFIATATGAANDLTITNATITGTSTLTSGRDIAAGSTTNNFGTTNAATGRNINMYDNAGTFTLNGVTATGTLTLGSASNGSISMSNVDATGVTNVTAGGGTAVVSGNTSLVFRSDANFNAGSNNSGGNNVNLTADFRGNTTFTGNQVTATNTAGNFNVTGISTGNSAATSTLTTTTGNLSISGVNLNSTGATAAGRLDASANGNVTIDGTGWNAANDIVNAWSTAGGNMSVANVSGLSALDGTVSSANPNSAAAGMHLATTGGTYTLTNDSVTGNTAITARNTITGTGNTFTGTTAFNANNSGNYDISLTSSDFQNATNGFAGANITVGDSAGNLSVSSATATGNFTATSVLNGNITLANTDVTGTTNVTAGGGTAVISGNTGLVFRGLANFNAGSNNSGGNNIALTGDFQNNTTFTGNQITATDTAGNFTVTGISTGNSASASTLAANAGNLTLSGINLNSTGATNAGRLDASALGNVSINGTGWTTTNDTLNAWSTGGGNMTVTSTTGLAALDGAVAAVNPNNAAAGMHLATNGGNYTLTNDSVTGNTAITSKGTINGTGDTFTGTTSFAANAGVTPSDITFSTTDFQNATNGFNGANVSVTDINGLTVSSATATGTGTFVATGAANDLTVSNANVTGNTTLTSGRNITATTNNDFGTITGTANGTVAITETGTMNINSLANSGNGTVTLISKDGSVIGKNNATTDVTTGTGALTVTAGDAAADTGSYVNLNIATTGNATLQAYGRSGTNDSIIARGTVGGNMIARNGSGGAATGNIYLGDSTKTLAVTGTTAFNTANTRDVIGTGTYTGAVSGSGGRIGFTVNSGNFTSGGMTAGNATGWYGASDESMIVNTINGDILGSGYTTSGAANIRLQAGTTSSMLSTNNIAVSNVVSGQDLALYATGDSAGNGSGVAIQVNGTSSVAGTVTASGFNASNYFSATDGSIDIGLSSGNLTTALVWTNNDNINLTTANGSILQNFAKYGYNGKTIYTNGGDVTLSAGGGAGSYISTGVNALGAGSDLIAMASGKSGSNLSVQLYGRVDGDLSVYNTSGAGNAVTGNVYLGTAIANPTLLDDVYTVQDVLGTVKVRAAGTVNMYGMYSGQTNIYSSSGITIMTDKVGLNIGTAQSTGSISMTSLTGSITGSNINSTGGGNIYLQSGSNATHKFANVNVSNLSTSGNLTVDAWGSTTGNQAGSAVNITGSVGGTTAATTHLPGGTVVMP